MACIGAAMSSGFSIDELEADLGQAAALRVIANCGGQCRNIPLAKNAARSVLAEEIGTTAACWIAGRFGGEIVQFPSIGGHQRNEEARRRLSAVIDAGLTDPSRSANDLAFDLGVSSRHVKRLRAQARADGISSDGGNELPLFRNR